MFNFIDIKDKQNQIALNHQNNSKKEILEKVLATELLLNELTQFLTFEERKTFFSINKKLNSHFRNNIYQINRKKILITPEIGRRFPNLKKIKLSWGCSAHLGFLRKKYYKNLESLKIKGDKYEDINAITEAGNCTITYRAKYKNITVEKKKTIKLKEST